MSTTHEKHPEACAKSPSGFHEYGMDLGCRYCPQIMRASAEAKLWLEQDIRKRRRDLWTLLFTVLLVLAAIVALVIGVWS